MTVLVIEDDSILTHPPRWVRELPIFPNASAANPSPQLTPAEPCVLPHPAGSAPFFQTASSLPIPPTTELATLAGDAIPSRAVEPGSSPAASLGEP